MCRYLSERFRGLPCRHEKVAAFHPRHQRSIILFGNRRNLERQVEHIRSHCSRFGTVTSGPHAHQNRSARPSLFSCWYRPHMQESSDQIDSPAQK